MLTPHPPLLSRGTVSLGVNRIPITHLGLRALREISDGDVSVTLNTNLCYNSPEHWTRLFRSDRQTARPMQNADPETCGESEDGLSLQTTTPILIPVSIPQHPHLNQNTIINSKIPISIPEYQPKYCQNTVIDTKPDTNFNTSINTVFKYLISVSIPEC